VSRSAARKELRPQEVPFVSDTVTVVPGEAANITFKPSPDHLIADGRSLTDITITARDGAGNLVADGTQVDWDLAGDGLIYNAQATTNKGQATITAQSGITPGLITVNAHVGGFSSFLPVQVLPLQFRFSSLDNKSFITLGTDETATIAVRVTDSTGTPVADGTPINWFIQKGGFAVKDSVVHGGNAILTIKGTGGSQIPGSGLITATVGTATGSTSFLWVVPANTPYAQVVNPILAGDQRFDGTFDVEQVDGPPIPYDYHATTRVTVSNAGNPGDVVYIQVGGGLNGGSGAGNLAAVGDDGQPGSYVRVVVDALGQAGFTLQSLGNVATDRMINVPISVISPGIFTNSVLTTFNVSLQPSEYITRTRDYVAKIGYAVLAGPGNSADEIAADMAFSFVPGIGVYSDIRDAASELFKLWPGGDSPDYVALGFALGGILTELTPADALMDIGKGFFKAAKAGIINANGIVFRTSLQKMKELGSELASGGSKVLDQLDTVLDDLSRLLPPPFGSNGVVISPAGLPPMPFARFIDDVVTNGDEFQSVQSLMKNINDFPDEVAGFAKYGEEISKDILNNLTQVSEGTVETLAGAQKLEIVAQGIKDSGWKPQSIEAYAKASADNQQLFETLVQNTVRFSPESVVGIKRTQDGRVVFLETGSSRAGLQHIVERHANDFEARGITQSQIPDAVITAVTSGKVVGQEGTGKNARIIYEFSYSGRTQRVAVGEASNGFVVTAHPVSF